MLIFIFISCVYFLMARVIVRPEQNIWMVLTLWRPASDADELRHR